MKILTISDVLKKQYGKKIQKLCLTSGCTCPNHDGTAGWGGCTFCSSEGAGEFAASGTVEEQIRAAKQLADRKFPASMPDEERQYIAYYQSFTNTYGDTASLRNLYEETIRRPEIVILSIGTRPDCLEEEKVRMLSDLNQIKPVWVELGLQTVHERTAEAVHRGYPLPVFEDAFHRLKEAGLTVIVHIIIGLPGESRDDILETVRYLARMRPVPDGIKIHMLHVMRGTALGEQYLRHPFPLPDLDEYCDLVVDCLKELPENVIIHRMTGDAPKRLLLAPAWSADKKRVLNTLHARIRDCTEKETV